MIVGGLFIVQFVGTASSVNKKGKGDCMDNNKVEHNKIISKNENGYCQIDKFKTTINLDILREEDKDLLRYWCIEDFDRAYISWKDNQLILDYQTVHYLPEDYALEILKDPDVEFIED